MLSSGVFQTPTASYTIYEIQEVGFYRIDFMRANGAFQTDVENVLYSQVHRKNTYVYGDSDIYLEFLRVKESIEVAKMQTQKESHWQNGEFLTTVTGVNQKLGYSSTSIMSNGSTTDYTLQGEGCVIHMFVVDPIYGVKLNPLNFDMYTKTTLSSDTIEENDGALYHSLDYLKKRYDLAWVDTMDFVVATNLDIAKKRLAEYRASKYPLHGFDTETSGLDVCMYGDDRVVGIILAEDTKKSTYFPFRHTGDFNLPIEFMKDVAEAVIEQEDHTVAHNKKFDREAMLKEGFDIHVKWDSMQASIVLNPIIQKGAHSLKPLVDELLGLHFLELDEIFVNPKDINFAVLPPDLIKYYACSDGTNTVALFQHQLEKLPKYQEKLLELECDLADVKADMEYYGIRVDVKKYERQYKNCNYILDMLLDAFRRLTQEDGNINSPQVLLPLLYNKMKCKVLLRTKTGQPSTSSAAIKKLAKLPTKKPHNITEDLVDLYGKTIIKASDLANARYPALVILAKYREYNKLKTAFYARFERTMKTGRVFFWVNQNGAATGRQSSPMHQLPPALKEVILSDADDRDFWGPDFSQIELRMIAYLAGETELIELAKDPNNDIHRIIGSLITGKEMWEITPEERSVGKRRNFGVVYLISARGLAGQIFGPGFTEENVEFCQQQLDDFYHHFKRIDRYIKGNAKKVKKYGYMQTAWFNRRRMFTEIYDPNIEPSKLASILRMANNVPVQGTAADYLKLAEVKMDKFIRAKGWNKLKDGLPLVRMMLSIHDEIIISSDQSIPYEEIVEMITECMETPVEGAPPFFAQPARMDCWAGHSNDALAFPIPFRDRVVKEYKETGKSIFKNSYFKLQYPDALVEYLNANPNAPTTSVVEAFLDQCTLRFDHGDYTHEFTTEHVKEALFKYVESGYTTYRIDNYLTLLNEYRDNELRDYMTGLVQKYGTDYKIVGQHVRHPSLTHELLGRFKKEMEGMELSHVDSITEATRRYIENMLTEAPEKKFVFKLPTVAVETDKDKFTVQLEQSVDFDKDGNVVFYDGEEEEDFFATVDDPDPDSIIYQVSQTPTYVWELGDIIVFDVQDMLDCYVNDVLKYIFTKKDDNGFYNVSIIYKGKLVDTKMRIEKLDTVEANNFVIQLNEKKELVKS